MEMKYVDETDLEKFTKVNTSSWDTMKDNVFIRLINEKYLNKYGNNIAHADFLDLSVVFAVQEKSRDTITSHILTKEELKKLNIDTKEVQKTAFENTSNDRKKRILTFKEDIVKNQVMYPILSIPKNANVGVEECSGFINDTNEDCDNVLMLSNKYGIFGSSYMVVPEILYQIYERFGNENFYIIPMSVHQLMCIRSGYVSHDGKKPFYEVEDDLLDMVEEFNDHSSKTWEDVLSYRVYYYHGDDGNKLSIIK